MAQPNESKELCLFGGDEGWHSRDWTASDDRVRGGKSQSFLEINEKTGRFYGTLDIKTLGGAGFASQRTSGTDREWDLSEYAGIQMNVSKGDKKRYTLNLKDTLLPPDPDTGRDQSTVTYECDFELPPQAELGHAYERSIFIPFTSFNATYRGRLKDDAKPINLKKIKQISIMMRSFFGTQEGDFSLTLRSICALSKVPSPEQTTVIDLSHLEKGDQKEHSEAAEDGQSALSPTRKAAFLLLGMISLFTVYTLLFPMSCGMHSE